MERAVGPHQSEFLVPSRERRVSAPKRDADGNAWDRQDDLVGEHARE